MILIIICLQYLDSITNTPSTDRRDSLPISFNKRKRKRFSQRINWRALRWVPANDAPQCPMLVCCQFPTAF